MPSSFTAGRVEVEVLDGEHRFPGVPTSQWHGDKREVEGTARLANLRAEDGLRAQVALVRWPEGAEWSLRMSDLLAGPADYDRLQDAGELGPKQVDANGSTRLVGRIRALRYKANGRAGLDVVEWGHLDGWAGRDARELLGELGATRTGSYSELLPQATRFKSEPAIEVDAANPNALFAVYALTRVMPIMLGHGRDGVEVLAP